MGKMYSSKDVNPRALRGQRIAVLGYGSQGRAQALCLRDSGCDVTLGLRRGGKTWKQAKRDGWKPQPPARAVKNADVIVMLVPDLAQAALYRDTVEPNLKRGTMLVFAHGFVIHYKLIAPPKHADVALVSPKGVGALLRRQFEEGRGVPCLVGIQRNATGKAFERALAYAHAIGGTRAGVMKTTFAEETESDLFSEQAVLCGGIPQLILAAWETLVAAGYSPEVAYYECLHEVKLIVDLLHEGGLTKMHDFISDTAAYGGLTRGSRVVDAHVRARLKKILAEVRSGAFAKEWVRENQSGRRRYAKLQARDLHHPIEKVGRKLRARMPWLETR